MREAGGHGSEGQGSEHGWWGSLCPRLRWDWDPGQGGGREWQVEFIGWGR